MHLLQTEFTELFCVSVFHFLWLATIPWILWMVVESMLPGKASKARYLSSIACLLAIALTIPVAVWTATYSPGQSTTRSVVAAERIVATNAIESERASKPKASHAESVLQTGPLHNSSNPTAAQQSETGAGDWIKAAAPTVFIVYLIGVILMTIRFANGFRRARSMRQRACAPSGHPISRIADQVARQLRLKTTPIVLWCEESAVPMVVGILRPVVLVPIQLATDATHQKLEHILLHEFFHVKRWDPVINCFQNLLETLLFFHPLVWIVSRKTRLLREISCDAEVVKLGVDAHQYANTLTEVATASLAQNRTETPELAIRATSGKTALRQRIEQLLNTNRKSTPTDLFTMAIVAFATSILLGLTFLPAILTAQEDTDELPIEAKMADLKTLPEDEFAGFVKDEAGNPIAGATVDVWHWYKGDETTTDSDGFFRFKPSRDRSRTRVEVRISKPGFSPYYNHIQTIGQKDFSVTLNRSTYVEGVLKDADGTSVPNTKVVFDQGAKQADGVMLDSVMTTATTDESGKYRAFLAPDDYTVKVQCAVGFANASTTVKDGESSTLDLELKQGANFEVIVVDSETGKPVEGLVLFRWEEPKMTAISDKDGKILIEGLIHGPLEFSVGHGEPVTTHGQTYYLHGNLGRWWSKDATNEWEQRTVEDDGWQRNFDSLEFEITKGMEPVKIVVERGVRRRHCRTCQNGFGQFTHGRHSIQRENQRRRQLPRRHARGEQIRIKPDRTRRRLSAMAELGRWR